MKRQLLALLASSAVFTAGCSNMMTTSATSSVSSQSTGGTLSGSVHGGSQPVAFAQVTLYYAGQSGIGSGENGVNSNPIVAATTTSADNGKGSFSFSKNPVNGQAASGNQFSCPTNDPLVYVVARGGNTLNNHDSSFNNSAAVFLGVFGACSQINASSFIALSEVTTVASMVALQQYFNPVTESIGADGIAVSKTALANTMLTISNLVDAATGAAVSSKTVTGGSIVTTVKPQTEKINALANILASCINNASADAAACTILMSSAAPPSTSVTSRPYDTPAFPRATDVLQAIYYMLANPTNGSTTNRQNLFNLIPTVGSAFQPTLTSAPSDWTISIKYSSTSSCNSGSFLYKPQQLGIDRYGNVWIANGESSVGNLSAMTPQGVATVCKSLGAGIGTAVDTAGKVWYAIPDANKVVRYDASSGQTLEFATAAPPVAIFADGGNDSSDTVSNIYFTTATGTALYMIAHGASATTTSTPVQISSVVGPNPAQLIVDASHAIWVSSGSNFVSRVIAGSSGDPNYLNGYSTAQISAQDSNSGVTVDILNGVYLSSSGTNSTMTYLTGSGSNFSPVSGFPTAQNLAGLNNPTALAIDGRSNLWAINTSPNSISGLSSLSEVSAQGAALFPSGTASGGLQLETTYLSSGRSLVIDQSGNVWIANAGTSDAPGNFLTEIVGAAVPMYQPFSTGLAIGRFQTMP